MVVVPVGAFQHIIELYDFPAHLETMTLESELRPFNDSGFILKWVDDTHCLAVFASAFTAEQALRSISGILVKICILFFQKNYLIAYTIVNSYLGPVS